jgi:hypothetical protein
MSPLLGGRPLIKGIQSTTITATLAGSWKLGTSADHFSIVRGFFRNSNKAQLLSVLMTVLPLCVTLNGAGGYGISS